MLHCSRTVRRFVGCGCLHLSGERERAKQFENTEKLLIATEQRRPAAILAASALRSGAGGRCSSKHAFKDNAIEPLPWAMQREWLAARAV